MDAVLRFFFVLTLVAAAPIHADAAADQGRSVPSAFDADRFELEIGPSAFVSLQKTTERRPEIDDAGGHLRVGWMLSSPSDGGFWRGNTEILIAALGSAVTKGPGSMFAGGTVILRRNFVQPGARWVPYAQLEGGALHNDVHDDRVQRVVGQALEFQLGGGFGLRFLFGESWAVYVEADYRHISNGGLANRNLGLNSVGGAFGVARFF